MAELTPVLGEDPAFLKVEEQVSRLAAIDRPCLVIGERGTGKELLATRLHYLSPRWDGPLVKVNCAALADSLIDTELFGHEAGAFTGAQRQHVGRFERADGGTLLLDEIASASAAVQEKVLRVIEYGEMERVGGRRTIQLDVRVIGTANVDLPSLARSGAFRADLLDRLAFEVVTLPPLRARPADVTTLANAFALEITRAMGRDVFPGFSPRAEKLLLAHSWPGNVRELKNVVERAVYRSASSDTPIDTVVIDPFDSPWRPPPGPPGTDPQHPESAALRPVVSGPAGVGDSASPSLPRHSSGSWPDAPGPAGGGGIAHLPASRRPSGFRSDSSEPVGNGGPPVDCMDRKYGSTGEDAPASPTGTGKAPVDFMTEIARFERGLLKRALDAARHNQSETARALGLGYHQLRRLLKKHALM